MCYEEISTPSRSRMKPCHTTLLLTFPDMNKETNSSNSASYRRI